MTEVPPFRVIRIHSKIISKEDCISLNLLSIYTIGSDNYRRNTEGIFFRLKI
jgi:hypothetical protein